MYGAFESLSPREKEVARLVSRGRANKEIARELDPPMAEATVAEHLRRIFRKVGVQNRTELAARWIEHQAHRGDP